MEKRADSPPVLNEVHEQAVLPGHGFFFSGVRGKNSGLRAIQSVLEKKFGVGSATTYSSAFLAERPTADRYEQMASAIKEKLQNGPVTILAHSYGAVEALRALVTDESLLSNQDNIEKIKLIFISPVIPEGWTDIAKKLLTFGKLNIQEGRLLGIAFPGKSSILSGILSANSLTTDVMSNAELDAAASLASPKMAETSHPGSQTIDDYERRDYLHLYDGDIQDKVRANDIRLKRANEQGRKWATRRALRRRGRVRRHVWPIYDGKHSDAFQDPQVAALPIGNRSEAHKLQKKLIFDAGRGREKAIFNHVQEKGIEIWRVDPKYDLMYTGRKAARRPQVSDDHVVAAPFTTHVGPWSVQSDILSAIIDACNTIQ